MKVIVVERCSTCVYFRLPECRLLCRDVEDISKIDSDCPLEDLVEAEIEK